MDHGGQFIGKHFLDGIQLLTFLLLILRDLVQRNEGEQLQAFDHVGIADISPVLVELIRARLVRIQPHRALRGLAHLVALGVREQRDGHGLRIGTRNLAADQFTACKHVRPLVIASELHAAVVLLV